MDFTRNFNRFDLSLCQNCTRLYRSRDTMMNQKLELFLSSVIAAIMSIIISAVVLPQFVVILTPMFDSINITSSSLLITYFGLIVIIAATILMILIFASTFPVNTMLTITLLTGILTLFTVMGVSYLILVVKYPEVFEYIPNLTRFVTLYQDPSLLVLKEQSPSMVWTLSLCVYLVLLNGAFVYLSDKGEKQK